LSTSGQPRRFCWSVSALAVDYLFPDRPCLSGIFLLAEVVKLVCRSLLCKRLLLILSLGLIPSFANGSSPVSARRPSLRSRAGLPFSAGQLRSSRPRRVLAKPSPHFLPASIVYSARPLQASSRTGRRLFMFLPSKRWGTISKPISKPHSAKFSVWRVGLRDWF